MTSYLAITCLKHSILREQELRVFLPYLPQEQFKEQLFHTKIYKGKRNRPKHELIDKIITGKNTKSGQMNTNFTSEDANKLSNSVKFLNKNNYT